MPTPITGIGKAPDDLDAVVQAVKAGGEIFLEGVFFFDVGSVVITNGVTILGNKARIIGGRFPFDIVTPGTIVTISGIRFDYSVQTAIRAKSAAGVAIYDCEINFVQPETITVTDPYTNQQENISFRAGIVITPGVSNKLELVGNKLNIGVGTTNTALGEDRTNGIVVIHQGSQTKLDEVVIANNVVSNVSAFGVDCRYIGGNATIQGNSIQMDDHGVSKPTFVSSGIRCLGSGFYDVRQNTIRCGSEKSAGIRLHGWMNAPITDSVVKENEIDLSVPSTVRDSRNAGIEIRGPGSGNGVYGNTITGWARAALSLTSEVQSSTGVIPVDQSAPSGSTLEDNNHEDFRPLDHDIIIAKGVIGTRIYGGTGGTISDGGDHTEINPDGNYK